MHLPTRRRAARVQARAPSAADTAQAAAVVAAAMGLLSKVLKEAVGPQGAFNLTLLNLGAGNFKEATKRGPDGLAPTLSRLLQGSHGTSQLAARACIRQAAALAMHPVHQACWETRETG